MEHNLPFHASLQVPAVNLTQGINGFAASMPQTRCQEHHTTTLFA